MCGLFGRAPVITVQFTRERKEQFISSGMRGVQKNLLDFR